jgi:seryl-tRNA synthetase
MPSSDLGASAFRKIDIEAYLSGKDAFGEISSTSNCTDFQSRRFFTRFKDDDDENKYIHTLVWFLFELKLRMALVCLFQLNSESFGDSKNHDFYFGE